MSLDDIGRVCISVRREFRLSDSQVRKIQSPFETALRNLLRLGKEIDLGRGEADRLVMRPDMDPQVIRAQRQKTGKNRRTMVQQAPRCLREARRSGDGGAAQQPRRSRETGSADPMDERQDKAGRHWDGRRRSWL